MERICRLLNEALTPYQTHFGVADAQGNRQLTVHDRLTGITLRRTVSDSSRNAVSRTVRATNVISSERKYPAGIWRIAESGEPGKPPARLKTTSHWDPTCSGRRCRRRPDHRR